MPEEIQKQFLTQIISASGDTISLNVTYHLEDSYPVVAGVVIDKTLDLTGAPVNLSDEEWERVWLKCESHKSQQPKT